MKAKNIKIFILFIFISLAGTGSVWAQKKGKIKTITVEQFQKKVKGSGAIQLVDVRTPKEFTDGHLKGATNYNVLDSTLYRNISNLNRRKAVFVYCKSGARSMRAAEQLKAAGFKVFNMEGGITNWNSKNLPTVK
ncbi:MAG TPA: rhodanese-like domain-containing protein [Ginsengibacter sp.]|nr:rhodanese-like domain-containing protein [Ginsengibacter sp.]HUN03893.1 rhodanese-like domain-containing protein [Niabella sp.]